VATYIQYRGAEISAGVLRNEQASPSSWGTTFQQKCRKVLPYVAEGTFSKK